MKKERRVKQINARLNVLETQLQNAKTSFAIAICDHGHFGTFARRLYQLEKSIGELRIIIAHAIAES